MKRAHAIILICLLLSGAALIAGASIYTPRYIQSIVSDLLKKSGFQNATIQDRDHTLNTARYAITLDSEDFSTIEEVNISFKTVPALLSKHLETLRIEKLRLTGEFDAKGNLTIAGWQPPSIQNLLTHAQAINSITFKDAQITLLSPLHGGISMNFDLKTTQDSNGLNFNGNMVQTQKNMRYKAEIKGHINGAQSWQTHLNILNAKINTQHISAARASGELTITKDKGQDTSISGQLRSGNIKIMNTSWQDADMTIQGLVQQPHIIIGAKSSHHKGIELGLVLNELNAPQKFSGYIYAEEFAPLIKFLEKHTPLTMNEKTRTELSMLKNTEIMFEKSTNILSINIKIPQKQINLLQHIKKSPDGHYNFQKLLDVLALRTAPQG